MKHSQTRSTITKILSIIYDFKNKITPISEQKNLIEIKIIYNEI